MSYFDSWMREGRGLPANLCDLCRYVTFNDPDEEGHFLCKKCLQRKVQEWPS